MIEPERASSAEASAAPAGEPAPPADASGPGALLGEERRRQGLSLGDIARQLKLSVRQIEALERDDYGMFSGMVFVRGFLRNYAKLLQLDPDVLLAALPGVTPQALAAPDVVQARVPVVDTRRAVRFSFGWLVGAAVLALLVIAALYEGRQHRAAVPLPSTAQRVPGLVNPQHADSPPPGSAAPAAAPPADLAQPATGTAPAAIDPAAVGSPSAEPAPEAPDVDAADRPALSSAPAPSAPVTAAPVAPVPAPAVQATAAVPAGAVGAAAATREPGQLRLKFAAEAWVEVKDGSGAVIFARLNSPGSEQLVQGRPPLQVVVGNAHGVQVSYQGRVVDLGPHTRVDVARLILE